jgi:predicted RecA/RadA family phage recombinase
MAEQIRLACPLTQTQSIPYPTPSAGVEKGEVINASGDVWGFAFSDASLETNPQTSTDAYNYAPSVLVIVKADIAIGAKASGTIAQYAKLYWDDSAKVMTTTASSNPYFGICRKAAASADTEVEFIFDRTGDI